jgi:lipopolysaccharide transport system permease protein
VLIVFRNVFRHRELFRNLVQRDLRTRYRNSLLGWGWAMLNPAIMTAVYAFIFTYIFKTKPDPGSPSGLNIFAFFLIAGILPWNFLGASITTGIGSVLGAGSLILRVRMPRELIPLSSIVALAVSLLVEFAVLFGALIVAGHAPFRLLPWILLLTILQFFFVAGVSLWLAALNVRYRDIQHLVGMALLVWFYLTPVLYPVSYVPTRATMWGMELHPRSIMLLNPMARFVVGFRDCFYDQARPDIKTLVGCFLSAIVAFGLGSRYYITRSRTFAEEL